MTRFKKRKRITQLEQMGELLADMNLEIFQAEAALFVAKEARQKLETRMNLLRRRSKKFLVKSGKPKK